MRNKKFLTGAILAVLLLTISVGGTLAYLVTSTQPVVNVFTPANEGTTIQETFENNVKSSVTIKNTGNIPVFVRVKVVANWYKDGAIVAPWTDNINYNNASWTKNDDYYYYNTAVAADTSTANLFADAYTYSAEEVPVKGAHLEMTIIHQSIQAEPTSAAREAWGYVPGSSNN